MKLLARERPRFGYRRLHVLVDREGQAVDQRRFYRLYRREQLQRPRRRPRSLTCRRDGNSDWTKD